MRKFIPIIPLILLLLIGVSHTGIAQEKVYKKTIPDPNNSAILFVENGTPAVVTDPVYADVNLRPLIGTVSKMQNVVLLKINEEADDYIPSDFTVSVPVEIIKTPLSGGPVITEQKTLQLSYKLGIGQKSDAASYYVSDAGGYTVSVQIKPSIVKNVSWDVIKLLRIDVEIRSAYDAPFDCSAGITGLTDDNPGGIVAFDELLVSWNYPASLTSGTFNSFPTGYDIEWAWVDENAAEAYQTNSAWDPTKIYFNNTTRVTVPISFNQYSVPLFYDGSGWIFYRVRAVQQRTDGQVINGNWSTNLSLQSGIYHFVNGHESGLNWQVSTSYAEDGKRKTVIQYFDGSLRGRQTVTKDNSQATALTAGTTVVAETYYDYQGRPTIQVLPAPTLSTVISFTRNFNNNNIDHIGYPKELYDLLQTGQPVCNSGAPPLDKALGVNNAHGAGNYYSAFNPKANSGFHKFIPEANGYAFAETRYTQDATGRVAAQGGVGQAHQIGSGYETKYFYSSATQDELDILFGTDAGVASHYQKTMVRDANGQFSVSYTDMFGRTVATALAGDNPGSLSRLKSLQDLYDNSLPAVKKQLIDEQTNVVSGRSISMVKELLVTKAGTWHFEYRFDPKQVLLKNCAQQDICFDCLYDLTITITDPCNGAVLHTETRTNFSLPYNSVCNTDPANIDIDFNVAFPTPGSYTISKVLTVSKTAQDYLREQAMQYGNLVCKTEETMYNEIRDIMLAQNTNCQPTCVSCTAALGTPAQFRTQFMTSAGLTEAQMPPYEAAVARAYAQAKFDCDAICENGSDRVNNYRDILLQDMMPDRGQYARIKRDDLVDANGNELPPVDITNRPFNIFNGNKYQSPIKENGDPDLYKNTDGSPDVVAQENLTDWSPAEFSRQFKESWADQLLYYHPEFKKLQLVESAAMQTAYRWQEQWQDKKSWSEVSTMMTGLPGSDPFYSGVLPGSSLQTQMQNKLQSYVTIGGVTAGMWQFAVASVKCKKEAQNNQLPCLNSCSNTIGVFPAEISCDPDKDMVWTIFKEIYFREREVFIYQYLQAAAPVDLTIFNVPVNPAHLQYQARFINPATIAGQGASLLTYLPSELQDSYNAAQGGSSSQAATELTEQYEENCRSYAVQWLAQLKVFDLCKPSNVTITDQDYTTLIATLVDICKRGSDETHPLGSSSASPSQPGTYNSFAEAINAFMISKSIPVSQTCHPYLLDWPKPYPLSPSLDNEEIWDSKPETCVCEKVNSIKALYDAAVALPNPTFSGTFSAYMKQRYGTVISDEVLTQLLNACNTAEPSCKYLATPIILPPALQCGAPTQICLDCNQYTTLRNQFLYLFSGAIPAGMNLPIAAPANALEESWNKTFTDFMNHQTGFNKQWHEYVAFATSCRFASYTDVDDCSGEVGQIINDFYTNLETINDGVTPCEILFTNYFNQRVGGNFSFGQIRTIIKVCTGVDCYTPSCCTTCLTGDSTINESAPCSEPLTTYLCGLNVPINHTYETEPDDPCQDVYPLIANASVEAWKLYMETVKDNFDKAYLEKCLDVKNIESLTVESPDEKEYHYTLYYYDQSGSLVQTVPPAGVYQYTTTASRDAFLASVQAARTSGGNPVRPAHTLVTRYRYNTLGQVVEQKSPDAGISKFWYDELGRLVVSQNAKQATQNKFSYTIYDELGRISQVGQKPTTAAISQAITRNKTSLADWLHNSGSAKEQITRTVYDVYYYDGIDPPGPVFDPRLFVQRNLRNRVSYSQVIPVEPTDFQTNPNAWVLAHSSATFYTYDIHGNVDELLQDYNEGPMKELANGANRFKKIAYQYDLISGKVNTVFYQPDYYDANNVLQHHTDRFYHRYQYDAENKLTSAETSHDGILWETDARYSYYKHGPLARTELGQQHVQGIDYAYTLQGWLKGVNSTAISEAPREDCAAGTGRDVLNVTSRQQYDHPATYVAKIEINFDPNFESDWPDNFLAETNPNLQPCVPVILPSPFVNGDMGQDGKTTGIHPFVARDAYSFSLNYFETTINSLLVRDYQSINTTEQPFATGMFSLTNTETQMVAKPLFNGNIASMFVNIPKLGAPQLYGYQYDQLNRIVGMDAFGGFNATANGWESSGPVATANYKERVSYDPNGNILTYTRNGFGATTAMDNLSYGYNKDVNNQLINNRLRHVKDAIGDANYTEDIDNQPDDNYDYDAIGNLIKDTKEGITNISWSVYGKILSITKAGGTISYTYDAAGNRISKTVGGKVTIYVRDASGNVMAVYEKGNTEVNSGHLSQTEVHLYGSSRLGMFRMSRDVESPVANTTGVYAFVRGQKVYELSNHLGNVLVTLSDRKLQLQSSANPALVEGYVADVITAVDYYPFGMDMPGRKSGNDGRYGFNGKERDKDMHSLTAYDYGFRIYNPAIGKFLSVDPLQKQYPELTPYQFASNSPIQGVDLDGREIYHYLLIKRDDGTTYLKYQGEQTRYFGWWEIFDKASPATRYMNAQGSKIKTKTVRVWLSSEPVKVINEIWGPTKDFSSFKALGDWRDAGFPSDPPKPVNPEAAARAETMTTILINEMYFRYDMSDGHFMNNGGDGLPDVSKLFPKPKSSPTEKISEQATAANGVGAVRRLEYEPAPYHGKTDNALKSRAPINGQDALDMSIQIKETSPRRIGIDYSTSDFVIFDQTIGNKYHGHVRSWKDLHIDMQNALKKAGMVDNNGKILTSNTEN